MNQSQETKQKLENQLAASNDQNCAFQRELNKRLREAGELESAAEARLAHFNKSMADCVHKINGLEVQVQQASSHRKELIDSRDVEIAQLQG